MNRVWIRAALIENWRGISRVVFPRFDKMNMLLGANGSCKSAILEAIHFIAGRVSPRKGGQRPQNSPADQRLEQGVQQFPWRIQLVLQQPSLDSWINANPTQSPLMVAWNNLRPDDKKHISNVLSFSTVSWAQQSSGAGPKDENQIAQLPEWYKRTKDEDASFARFEELKQWGPRKIPGWHDTIGRYANFWGDGAMPRVTYIPASRESLTVFGSPHTTSGNDTPERRLYRLRQEGFDPWYQSQFLRRVRALGKDIPPLDIRENEIVYNRERLATRTIDVSETHEARGIRDSYKVLACFDDPCEVHIPDIVLLDEPELSKHEGYQRSLLDCLTNEFPETQFVISTHSSVFAEDRPQTTVHFLRREEKGVKSVLVTPEDRKARASLRASLGVTNSQIFSISHVLYVEGETEEECVTRVLRALGCITGPSGRITIANARGVGKLNSEWLKPQLRIIRSAWATASIWSDDEGKVLKQRDDLQREFPDVIREKDFIIWSDWDKSYAQFLDTLPHEVVLTEFKSLLSDDGFKPTKEDWQKAGTPPKSKIEWWLKKTWYTFTKSDYPKARFGAKCGDAIADMISQGKSGEIRIVGVLQDLLERLSEERSG